MTSAAGAAAASSLTARFVAASANVEHLDEQADGFDIVTQRRDDATIDRVLSNSFGFGGTNACLVFQRYNG